MKKWDVDISVAKTHVSKDTYEFAKRWIKVRGWVGDKPQFCELSGLPMKGIIANYTSPKIVFEIIFDYVRKGNMFLHGRGYLDLLIQSYNGILIGKRRLSPFTIRRILYDYIILSRYAHDTLSYDEMRYYLTQKVESGDIMIPDLAALPEFMARVLNGSVLNQVKNKVDEFIDTPGIFESF